MTDAARKILTQEGIRGLYKGTIPCILLTAPEAAFRFGVYQFLNNNWDKPKALIKKYVKKRETKEAPDDQEIGILQSSVNGGIAGIFAKTMVYPFDLIKKRLQVQGFEEARTQFGRVSTNSISKNFYRMENLKINFLFKQVKFTGVINCLLKTVYQEGVLGLYKGYLPSMFKAWASSALVFLFFEKFSNIARKTHDKKNH